MNKSIQITDDSGLRYLLCIEDIQNVQERPATSKESGEGIANPFQQPVACIIYNGVAIRCKETFDEIRGKIDEAMKPVVEPATPTPMPEPAVLKQDCPAKRVFEGFHMPFFCTREAGHSGQHEAHGTIPLRTWPNENDNQQKEQQ